QRPTLYRPGSKGAVKTKTIARIGRNTRVTTPVVTQIQTEISRFSTARSFVVEALPEVLTLLNRSRQGLPGPTVRHPADAATPRRKAAEPEQAGWRAWPSTIISPLGPISYPQPSFRAPLVERFYPALPAAVVVS